MDGYREEIYRLMLATNKCDGVYYEIAKCTGVKENTLVLLYALSDGKSHSQKQICGDWLIPKTTLNTVVKECVIGGYITLLTEKQSKEKTIRLTESGKKFAQMVTKKMNEAEEKAMERVRKEFSVDFILAFEKFVNYLEEEYRRI